MRRCVACGFEADNFPEFTCPQCGKKLPFSARVSPWLLGLMQAVLVVGFMLVFHFPRPMAAFFALAAFLATGLSGRRRTQSARPDATRQTTTSRPVLAHFRNVAIVLCCLAFVLVFVCSFFVFMGNWSEWSATRGQSYHATSFQVMKVYFQQPPPGRDRGSLLQGWWKEKRSG